PEPGVLPLDDPGTGWAAGGGTVADSTQPPLGVNSFFHGRDFDLRETDLARSKLQRSRKEGVTLLGAVAHPVALTGHLTGQRRGDGWVVGAGIAVAFGADRTARPHNGDWRRVAAEVDGASPCAVVELVDDEVAVDLDEGDFAGEGEHRRDLLEVEQGGAEAEDRAEDVDCASADTVGLVVAERGAEDADAAEPVGEVF